MSGQSGAHRVFWLSNERPNGPITFWRGNGGVDWEAEYVPADRLAGAVEELNVLQLALENACDDAWTDGVAAMDQYVRRARVSLSARQSS